MYCSTKLSFLRIPLRRLLFCIINHLLHLLIPNLTKRLPQILIFLFFSYSEGKTSLNSAFKDVYKKREKQTIQLHSLIFTVIPSVYMVYSDIHVITTMHKAGYFSRCKSRKFFVIKNKNPPYGRIFNISISMAL